MFLNQRPSTEPKAQTEQSERQGTQDREPSTVFAKIFRLI